MYLYFTSSGGKLIFDEKDVELNAENVLITDGGLLQVTMATLQLLIEKPHDLLCNITFH